MREVVFDFEEFKAKVDTAKPIHHCVYRKCTDRRHGIFYRLEFWMTALPKNSGNYILCFYAERRTTISDRDRDGDKEWVNGMVKKFAEPLGSTEGEWKP